MGAIFRVFIFLTALLLTIKSTLPAEPVIAQEGPPVLAFYYAWFDQNTWTSGQSVDLPAEGYISTDRATIERQVQQAQRAGIDAFVQSWYGPQEANNQTETNFRTLLDVAGSTGFKAAVDLEVTGPFFADAGAVTNALTSLLTTHAQHPAYLRFQGKPVIFFWRQQRFSLDEWAAIRNQVDPNRDSYWIAEGVDIAYQNVFDGHHLYSIAWAASPADQLTKWGNRVRTYENENQVDRLWVATTMPGYDDTRLPRADAFAVPRQNGEYYRQTWQGAVASQPDMIIITSFNEWLEGTQLEPSASYGNLYLDVTRELVTGLRGSPPAAPAAIQVAEQPNAIQVDTAANASAEGAGVSTEAKTQAAQQPEEPYIETETITNVRSGPATNFERVGRLAAGETASVIGKNEAGDWWLIEFAAGENGQAWVFSEVVNFFGEAAEVSVSEPGAEVTPEIAFPIAEIPAGGINVRSGPGLDFEPLGRLDEGETVTIVGKSEAADWWQIEYSDSEDGRGWITAALVDVAADASTVPVVSITTEDDVFPTPSPSPTVPVPAGQIQSSDAINVRAEPSLDGTVVGGLYLDETADVYAISEDGLWWQIEFEDGPDGLAWVTAEFVRFLGDEENVPVFGAQAATPTPEPTNTPAPTLAPTLLADTPTPADLEFPATFAPTATSEFDATAAAIVEERGTPDPASADSAGSAIDWGSLPWGILAILLVGVFVWFQVSRRRG